VFSKIVSKVLVDERVLGGRGEKVLFLIFTILGLMGSDMSKDVKADNWGGRDGGTSDNVHGAVGDVEEGVIFRVVKGGPSELGGWGTGDDGLEDAGGDVKRACVTIRFCPHFIFFYLTSFPVT